MKRSSGEQEIGILRSSERSPLTSCPLLLHTLVLLSSPRSTSLTHKTLQIASLLSSGPLTALTTITNRVPTRTISRISSKSCITLLSPATPPLWRSAFSSPRKSSWKMKLMKWRGSPAGGMRDTSSATTKTRNRPNKLLRRGQLDPFPPSSELLLPLVSSLLSRKLYCAIPQSRWDQFFDELPRQEDQSHGSTLTTGPSFLSSLLKDMEPEELSLSREREQEVYRLTLTLPLSLGPLQQQHEDKDEDDSRAMEMGSFAGVLIIESSAPLTTTQVAFLRFNCSHGETLLRCRYMRSVCLCLPLCLL
jgi:hypothetical protein